MLIFDFHMIGNRLLSFRKRAGLTQAEVAEAAGLSDRSFRRVGQRVGHMTFAG